MHIHDFLLLFFSYPITGSGSGKRRSVGVLDGAIPAMISSTCKQRANLYFHHYQNKSPPSSALTVTLARPMLVFRPLASHYTQSVTNTIQPPQHSNAPESSEGFKLFLLLMILSLLLQKFTRNNVYKDVTNSRDCNVPSSSVQIDRSVCYNV